MPNLQNTRLWFIGGAVVAVLIIIFAWFALIGPQLSQASSYGDQTTQAQQQNSTLRTKVAKLQVDASNMDALNKQLQDARAALPTDSGMPSFTQQVADQSRAAGVAVSSIVAQSPKVAGSAPGAAAPAPDAVPAAGSLYSIDVTVTTEGPLVNQRAFLTAVEQQGPRRALVNSVTFGAAAGNGGAAAGTGNVDVTTSMTAKLQVFVAPQAPAPKASPTQPQGN